MTHCEPHTTKDPPIPSPALETGEPAITAVVFSRDRAMQLDAVLTSLTDHCREASAIRIDILYTASTPFLARQYAVLERTWRAALNIRFHRESDFRTDLLALLDTSAAPSQSLSRQVGDFVRHPTRRTERHHRPEEGMSYVLFLVDDNIFVRDFSFLPAITALILHPRAIGVSLRLGRNTEYCYSLDAPQRIPHLAAAGDGVLVFDWTNAEHDFGYALEVSSSLYEAGHLRRVLGGLKFDNPNTLESQFAGTSTRWWARRHPELLCYDRSVAFCNAVNKVQAVYNNRSGKEIALSPHELAMRFDRGERIDTQAFRRFTPNACHCAVPFAFTQDRASQGAPSPCGLE